VDMAGCGRARPQGDEGAAADPPLFGKNTHPHVEQMRAYQRLSTPDGLKDLTAIIECESPAPGDS